MSLINFIKSKSFFLNLLLAIAIIILLVLLVIYSLRSYTNHGESLSVPNFSGLTLNEVNQLITEKNLRFEINDSTYIAGVAPGTVLDQSPIAGAIVKEGRNIFITISATSPDEIAMPKLTDISLRQAQNILQTDGLVLGEVTYVPSEYSDLVLSQMIDSTDIDVGTMVSKGTVINLTVGQSMSGELTIVPDLAGVTLELAKSEIQALSLVTGAVIYDESIETMEDSLEARIWQQRPAPSNTEDTEMGTSIDLWLTIDAEKLVSGEEIEILDQETDYPEDTPENDFF